MAADRPLYRRPWLLAVTAVALMAFLGYGHLAQPGMAPYSPCSDILTFHAATQATLYRSQAEGRGLPFWRSDQLSGNLGLHHPQALYTFPLGFLFHFLPPEKAIGPTILLLCFVAGAAYFILGASLGLGFWSRLFMAAAGMFGSKLIMAVYAGWLPVIYWYATVPLLWAAVFGLTDKPGIGRSLAATLAGFLCLHTGHMQLLYYASLLLSAYLAAWAWRNRRVEEGSLVGRGLASVIAAGLLAICLSAYLFLPLLVDLGLTTRSLTTYNFFLNNHALKPRHLLMFLYPEFLGSPLDGGYPGIEIWEDQAYFGAIALLLALAGIVLGRKKPRTGFFIGAFLLSVALSLDTPLLRLFYEVVPGFKLFRGPSRLLFTAALNGVILAGIGLEEIQNRLSENARRWPAVALGAALIVLTAVEGIWWARRYALAFPVWAVFPKTDYARALGKDPDLFRIAPLQRSVMNYAWAAPADLQLITGYDPYNYRHYIAYADIMRYGAPSPAGTRVWMDRMVFTRPEMLDVLNVKYLLSDRLVEKPPGSYEFVASWPNQPMFYFYQGFAAGDVYMYENREFRKRAFFVSGLEAAADEKGAADLVMKRDMRQTAVVIGPRMAVETFPDPGRGLVEVLSHADGRLRLRTTNPAAGFLVISEVWHPGWRARLDGLSLPLLRADLALMGARLPPGEHEIEMAFSPPFWRLGLGLSLAALVIFLAACGKAISMMRSPKQP